MYTKLMSVTSLHVHCRSTMKCCVHATVGREIFDVSSHPSVMGETASPLANSGLISIMTVCVWVM